VSALPIDRPQKIVCVGLNYRDHAEEQGTELPTAPLLFAKWPNALIGPGEPIVIPRPETQTDYEVELAVVIGRAARRVREAHALDYVFGYTILNDVSARDVQFRNNQLTLGKNFDTFAPMGPCLATPEELGNPQDVEVRTFVNGESRQRARTSSMLFDIPTLIAWVSEVCTLEPGDVLSTGTPAGVGAFRRPPRFLEPDDVVRMEIDGIGAIENRVASRP
jgi:2-keto-4-pentenoate hydratase/2-oxohepta-3-ene-1,7-dioic acid hydratase in catechol pathway